MHKDEQLLYAMPGLLSKATSYICFANTTHLTCR